MSASERAFLRHLADGLTAEQADEREGLSARASHGRLRRLRIALKAWTPTHTVATALRLGLINQASKSAPALRPERHACVAAYW